jgi:hypothetical protein
LLRCPFTKIDFDDFLIERQETIRDAIENLLIKEKLDIPVALKSLNDTIEKIELRLRDIIITTFGDEFEHYKKATPGHTQEKVEKRIASELKKKPGLNPEDFILFSQRLKFFDLFELYEIITTKNSWNAFEDVFRNKEQLQNRFNQLSTLRNCIRHSREVTTIEKLDGEAAIAWFNQIIKN